MDHVEKAMKIFKQICGPWRVASSNFDTGFHVIHGKDPSIDANGRELQIVKLEYGRHPVRKYLSDARRKAMVIAEAPRMLHDHMIELDFCEGILEGGNILNPWARQALQTMVNDKKALINKLSK